MFRIVWGKKTEIRGNGTNTKHKPCWAPEVKADGRRKC